MIKYPKIQHLSITEAKTRDDKVLSEEETNKILKNKLIILEKLDGHNLGISFNDCYKIIQHRGSFVDLNSRKAKNINQWYKIHEDELIDICQETYILFGEWLYWKHSINYTNLPSFFMAFDLFDKKEEKFLSQKELAKTLKDTDIEKSPIIFEGETDNIKELINKSQFSNEDMEGLIIRIESNQYNEGIYKTVRKKFLDNNKTCWLKKLLIPNKSIHYLERNW